MDSNQGDWDSLDSTLSQKIEKQNKWNYVWGNKLKEDWVPDHSVYSEKL